MGQRGERVGLVHELRELAAREEVRDDGAERLGVHELLRAEHLRLVLGVLAAGHRHALVDGALRARQADAALVLQQLARGADAAGAEVVDVVDLHGRRLAVLRDRRRALGLLGRGVDGGEEAEGGDDVALVQDAQVAGQLAGLAAVGVAEAAELEVELVAAHLPQVVAAVVEEEAADELLRVGGRHGVARAEAVVDVLEGLLLAVRRVGAHRLQQDASVPRDVEHLDLGDAGLRELVQRGGAGELVAVRQQRVGLGVADVLREDERLEPAGGLAARRNRPVGVEVAQDVAVRRVLEAAQERRDEELAALAPAVHVDPDLVVRVELELEPRAAVRDDADGIERRAVGVQRALGADARRAVQLRDDHALGAVDHERAGLAHERDLAHVDPLAAGLLAVLEEELDVERGGVRHALAQREQRVVLRLDRLRAVVRAPGLRGAEAVLEEVQHVVPVVALDREDALEDPLQADVGALLRGDVLLEELLVGLGLDFDLVGRGKDGLELAVDGSFCHRGPRVWRKGGVGRGRNSDNVPNGWAGPGYAHRVRPAMEAKSDQNRDSNV